MCIGGMDKTQYYIAQIERLLEDGLKNVVAQCNHSHIPIDDLQLAKISKKIKLSKKNSNILQVKLTRIKRWKWTWRVMVTMTATVESSDKYDSNNDSVKEDEKNMPLHNQEKLCGV